MVRAQITLDAEAHRRAKRRAADLGISFAEYVRRVLDEDLGAPTPSPEATQIFGLFDSGPADVARQKGDYVDDAVRANRQGTRHT